MGSVAEWLAPAATMLAAVMTAANLGARITGWGFVVFTLGSICWIIVGLASGQSNLIITNGFLTLVNMIGIWRWLGRQARYEAAGNAAEMAGQSLGAASVIAASGILGRAVIDPSGETAGEAVETILDCRTGAIRHIIVRFGGVGGVGEQIVALSLADICLYEKTITTTLSAKAVASLPRLGASKWPSLLTSDPAELS